jgi:DNA-binding CsgD family transcriptional regulator
MLIAIDDELVEGLCDMFEESDPEQAVCAVLEYALDRFGDKRTLIEEHRRLLGVVMDLDVAPRLGVGVQTVRKVRRSLGIPPSRRRYSSAEKERMAGRVWELLLAGHHSGRQIALEVGCHEEFVTRVAQEMPSTPRRRSPAEKVLTMKDQLGKRRDTDIARELGVSPGTVLRIRRELGIPATKRRGSVDLEDVARLLREGYDVSEVAIVLKTTPNTILRARRQLAGRS